MVNRHQVIRWIVAVVAGATLAIFSYHWITDPAPRQQRAVEEAVVKSAREILFSYISPVGTLDLVDPLAPDRKIGKAYVYPGDTGWDISGHYRRDDSDPWHPWLMTLSEDRQLVSLAVKDGNDRLIGLSASDPKFSAVP